MFKILIMGLPGSGKTTLAQELHQALMSQGQTVTWFNADQVREQYNDWDFSMAGRIRQSERIANLANTSSTDYVIADFVAPLDQQREIFAADYVIWMDTISSGRFADTNTMFQRPDKYNYKVEVKDSIAVSKLILIDLTTYEHTT